MSKDEQAYRLPSCGVAGAPPLFIDWKRVEEYLECGCSGMQIAATLGIHKDTLYDRTKLEHGMYFSDYSAIHQATGEGEIKKAQYMKALGKTKKGDTTLLTFLGRTRLKMVEAQPEKPEVPVPNELLLQLTDENLKLRAIINARSSPDASPLLEQVQRQTDPELQPSDGPIQHMGGSDIIGEDAYKHRQIDRETSEWPEGGCSDNGSLPNDDTTECPILTVCQAGVPPPVPEMHASPPLRS